MAIHRRRDVYYSPDDPAASQVTAAHSQRMTETILTFIPEHPPRENDPRYKLFHQAHDRIVKAGLLKCWIANADCGGAIELHHDKVEFSLINDVDETAFAKAYGLSFASDDDFQAYIESEGNLLCLCVYHHRGHGGIHFLPYPLWVIQKYLKAGVTAPAKAVPAGSA